MHTRAAFSLTEVLFALLILSLGILSIILLFPVGIRAQEQSRYQMYASIKAMELSDALAQHTKNFSDRIHEMTGDLSGERIVEGAIYGSFARFDAETVWTGSGKNGVYPVPVEIARRLDSPGGEIQQVLDSGAYLFYHDPRPVRGFSQIEATNPSGTKIAPELQRLVFAVVGAPQQNALPQHPCLQGPVYLIYPFAPQGPRLSPGRYKAKKMAVPDLPHVYEWDTANISPPSWETALWEPMNWELLASNRFEASTWRNGLLAFRNLCYFGWTPFEYKMNGSAWDDSSDPASAETEKAGGANDDGIALEEDTESWGVVTKKSIVRKPGDKRGVAITSAKCGVVTGGRPYYWSDGDAAGWKNDLSTFSGSFIAGYNRDAHQEDPAKSYLTVMDAFHDPGVGNYPLSFRDFITDPGFGLTGLGPDSKRFDKLVSDVIGAGLTDQPGDPKRLDPNTWTYRELGTNEDPRLPSLQQRYLLRWLALKLWRDVTIDEPALAALNPFKDVIPTNIEYLDPARVLALSHLADAAMRVGGMRLPMWEDPSANGALQNLGERLGASNANATDKRSSFAGSITDETAPFSNIKPRQCIDLDPLDPNIGGPGIDVAYAKMAHENCIRWAIAYVNRFPRDNLVPRPANRQVMTDRPLWQWDLFDDAGKAIRVNKPETWQNAPLNGVMPGYKVLPRPGIAADPALADKASDFTYSGPPYLPLPRLAPGFQTEGGQQRYGTNNQDVKPTNCQPGYNLSAKNWTEKIPGRPTRWFNRMSQSAEPTFDVKTASRARRFSLNAPFAPQNRMRQIVYWAVNWKEYEDCESAPSAPQGVEIMGSGMDSSWWTCPSADTWNEFDPSESGLIWFGRDRTITFSDVFGTESTGTAQGHSNGTRFYSIQNQGNFSKGEKLASIRNFFDVEGLNHTFGFFGADRDGNGVYKNGTLRASTRLRATEVARFNYYDPIVWCHLRK